ncbi:cyclic nucleotide-binding domain-containing protein [Chelativorans intermedius]|uniref:Cyclic nucleotide-binding domain-containing protein n=1 Tax=Chelativorans intermedius TaxID=515947 RepID=A0ABV6D797_9HYPH|nr:cyclic nucleotide-binding domain-containing protein [Chelativorans intermedius]MCT8999313.1 cyclic nucleotide-binding domain-containing protein [Chelativorans intermedius]
MALDDDIRVLSGVGLFKGFTREQLRLMAFGAETITLGAGHKLYAEGAPADCAFVVAAGEVALYHQRGEEREIISVHGPGAILGELALIAESVRLTSAVAQTDVKVIRLNRSMFRRILEEFPETAVRLHRRIAAGLQDMLSRMSAVAARLER